MKNILIIEDDLDIQSLVEYILIDAGFKVVALTNKPTIALVISIKPDLILLDHYLYDGFGGDFCLELKRDYITKKISVLMLSAHNRLSEIAKANCADGFIAKPFDIVDLLANVQRFFT